MTVIAEFDAGISEATMHALADEILKYRRAVRLLAKAAGRTSASKHPIVSRFGENIRHSSYLANQLSKNQH